MGWWFSLLESVIERLWAMSHLAHRFVELVFFVQNYVHSLPGRVKPLLTHFGFVRFGVIDSKSRGPDFMGYFYAIVGLCFLSRLQNVAVSSSRSDHSCTGCTLRLPPGKSPERRRSAKSPPPAGLAYPPKGCPLLKSPFVASLSSS